jgi:ribonuclease Z
VILPADDYVLADSVRSCIKIDEIDEYNNENDASSTCNENWKDPRKKELKEMSLCFIGTGAGSPANIRSTSCTLLKLSGTNYLFDVGEGTQRQLQFARGKGSTIHKIEKIFVTHLHGDHVFGLPGLLLSLQTSCVQSDENARATNNEKVNRRRRRKNGKQDDDDDYTVQIYGPPGLFNYIASSITLSCTRMHLLKVEVYELMGGRVRRVATPPPGFGRHLPRGSPRQQQQFRDPFQDDYPEFRHNGGNIQRIFIPCENGVWNIQHKLPPLTRQDIMTSTSRDSSGGGRIIAKKQQDRIRIRAAEVDHMPGVATFGYVVEEDEPPRNLDVAKARALGVSHQDKKYELLKHGFAVETDDGSGRMVEPHEVLTVSSKKARKIAIIGDNRGWTPEMTEIARNADVLVHEATLLEEDNSRGHSTAAKAGKNAERCNAKLLILNHISPKMEPDMPSAVREAYDASSRKVSVLISFDFLEVLVPWLGFGTTTAAPRCDSNSGSNTENLSTGSNDDK